MESPEEEIQTGEMVRQSICTRLCFVTTEGATGGTQQKCCVVFVLTAGNSRQRSLERTSAGRAVCSAGTRTEEITALRHSLPQLGSGYRRWTNLGQQLLSGQEFRVKH